MAGTELTYTAEVKVTVIPRQVTLDEGHVYLVRDGALINCGLQACILGHATRTHCDYFALRDHLDPQPGGYVDSGDRIHIIRAEVEA